MDRARYTTLCTLLVGVGCLSAGFAVGHWLPRREVPHVWTGAAAPAGAPSSFADVVARASPGVVTLRARVAAAAAGKPAEASGARPVDPLFNSPVFRSDSGSRNGSGFV